MHNARDALAAQDLIDFLLCCIRIPHPVQRELEGAHLHSPLLIEALLDDD
jgi:hypothetical protein